MASSLHDDAKKIRRIIPKWELEDILRTLTTYENHANRTELTVKKYIRHFDQGLTKEKCIADAKEIHQLFPQYSFANIISKVSLLGREVNRVRVTVRLLLRESYKREYEEKNTERDSQSTVSNHNSDSQETLNSADSTNNLATSENELSKKCNDAIDAFDKSDMNDSLNSFNNVMNEADLLIAKFDLDSLNTSLPKDTQKLKLDVPKIPQINALSLNISADNKPSTSTAKEQPNSLKLPKAAVSFQIGSPSGNSNTCRDIKVFPSKLLEARQDSPSTSRTTNLPEKERDFFQRHLRDFFDNTVPDKLQKMSKDDLAAAKKIAETDFSKVTNIAPKTAKRRSVEKSEDSGVGKKKKIRWDTPVIDLDTQPLVPTTSNDVIEINDTMEDITLPFDQDGNDSNTSFKDFFDNLDALAHDNEGFPPLEGYSHEEASAPIDYKLFTPLMNIFPNACPTFLKNLCGGKVNDRGVLDELINTILEMDDYPKRNVTKSPEVVLDVEEQWELMKQVLPDADPCYLKKNIENLINEPEKLKEFIDNAMEMGNYPTMKEYLRKQQLSAQTRQYTTEFSVEKFVESIPDPKSYFKDKPSLVITGQNKDYLQSVLKNHYDMLKVATMHSAFTEKSVTAIFQKLGFLAKCKTNHMKNKRKAGQIYDAIQDIPFLQEVAYNLHRKEIELYMKEQETRAHEERLQAKKDGLLKTCACCYDDEVMPKDIVTCENGCMFCKSCVQRSTEVAFGDGKLEFPCLADCGSKFNLQMLKNALTPKLFSRLAQKKQLEEVKSAGLEDLEMCPFCDFATIPATGDKLFRCLNAECMKESCRECKEPSHIPLRCDEVEKDEAVKARTYIEDKMTEALLRKCWKCGIKFIKSDGCNKMTCSCGAHMCYVCNKPVKDYKHFNGQGGDRFDLCPLYSDTNKLHEEAVMKSGIEAKKEIADPTKLLVDPTADIQKHYQEYKAKNPVNLPFGMQENPVVQQQQQQDLLLQVQEERRPPPPPGGPYYRLQVERGNPRGRADHRDRDRHNRRDNLRDQARRYDIDNNRQMAPPPLPPHNELPQPPPPPPLRPYHHHNHHNGLRPPVLNHVRLPPNHPANLRNYERHQQLHPPWFPDEDRRY